ncbi:MAG: DUF4232 domain-containing protein, partial [Thiobacillus sp.]|nr:DUF4232 domain-containing protein [Thiobacillus sp.]
MPRPSLLAAALTLLSATVLAQTPAKLCSERTTCTETARFAAEMAEFRFSRAVNSYRMVTATLRFTNKSDAPLTLAYVDGSAVAIDDAGNRYVVQNTRTEVQGIGIVTRNRFDPTFTLAPGESAEARVTVRHFLKGVQGTVFDFDVAIREIEPTPGGGYKLGRENLLRYSGLRDGMAAAPRAAAPAAGAAAQAGDT